MTPSEAIAVLRDAIRDTALETDMKKRWDIADHALAATESVQDGWMPIEAAPKDGTRILCWVPWLDGAGWHTGHFKGEAFYPDFRDFHSSAPTRWQPLPPPPATNQEKP